MKLKVLSWNIWQGNKLDLIIEFLKNAKADIIALQEVIEKDDTNTAAIIAEALGYKLVYYPAIQENTFGVPQGNAILSKYPIIESKPHLLSDISLYVNTPESEPRIAVETTIRLNGVSIKVFSVHLAYSHAFGPSRMRDLQIDNLLKLLPHSRTILMGDFNSYPDSKSLEKVSDVMKNTDTKLTEPTWTIYPFDYGEFRETELRHRLDYIYVSKDVHVENFRVEQSRGSDHLPISAIAHVK